MNNPNGLERLEDVLDAYVASNGAPDARLDDWIQRYPQYEQELIEFAISWSLMESLPPELDTDEVSVDTLVLRGMSVVQNLLHGQSLETTSVSVPPFESLLSEGRVQGLEPRQFAQVARLGVSLLRKARPSPHTLRLDTTRRDPRPCRGNTERRSERLSLSTAKSSISGCNGTSFRPNACARRAGGLLRRRSCRPNNQP